MQFLTYYIALHADTDRPVHRIQRIVVSYSHAGLASIDLVGAILRQGSFITKMVGMGWTQPGRFNNAGDLAPLVRSIARYHAFLDLMSQNASNFLVPTLVCYFPIPNRIHRLTLWF